jgi:LysM repeat protein
VASRTATGIDLPRRQDRRTLLVAGACALLAACSPRLSHTARPLTTTSGVVTVATTTTVPPTPYRVERGDTLTGIARKFGVPVVAIVAINHIANVDTIAQGQVLLIPPAPPVTLVITPPHAQLFASFRLHLTGVKPSEVIIFEIGFPDGRKFTGPHHVAEPDGTVSTTFLTTQDDPPGTYTVVATGNQGTSAKSSFGVDALNPVPSSQAASADGRAELS